MVLEHIASGMYGAVVVEPRAGFPTKVDREYVIIQSEFYAKLDPDHRTVDGVPLYVLDGDRLGAAQPTHTVFHGVHNGMVRQPLPARAGERVRLRAQRWPEQDVELPCGRDNLTRHVGEGRDAARCMYLATVSSATS